MNSETITINKEDLGSFVREIVKEELEKANYISEDEQKELEVLHGDSLYKEDYNKKDSIRL